MGAFRVGVLGVELPAVVVHRALPHHRTNRPFQINTPFAAPAAAFVTFCESNAKALLTACRPSKAHLRPTGWNGGFAPAVCGRLPQQGRPLKRSPCTPPKLCHSPLGRWERHGLSHHPASVLRGPKVKGYGLYCLAAISTRRYAPLTFDPAPRDGRDDRDNVSDTAPALKKPSQPSRSSRLGRFQRQADTSPGVAPAVLIADVVVYQQLPGPDV